MKYGMIKSMLKGNVHKISCIFRICTLTLLKDIFTNQVYL